MKSANDQVQLKLQVLQLSASLEPFIKFANANYPELSQDVALRRLAADFEGLRAENAHLAAVVREVDRREEFQPLATIVRDSVMSRLPQRTVHVPETGLGLLINTNFNRQNVALAKEIVSLLGSTWVAPRYDYKAYMGQIPDENTGPVGLGGPESLATALEAIRSALSPIFRDSIELHITDDVSQYGLWFLETPRFDSLGRVSFR